MKDTRCLIIIIIIISFIFKHDSPRRHWSQAAVSRVLGWGLGRAPGLAPALVPGLGLVGAGGDGWRTTGCLLAGDGPSMNRYNNIVI